MVLSRGQLSQDAAGARSANRADRGGHERQIGRSADAETSGLATREAQAGELQGFRGGSGVYIYVGSGALVVVLVVLLILLVV